MRITVTSANNMGEREIVADFPDVPFDYLILVTTTTQLLALLNASEGGNGWGDGGDYEAPVDPPPVPSNRFCPTNN